jgi:hypothetical protein
LCLAHHQNKSFKNSHQQHHGQHQAAFSQLNVYWLPAVVAVADVEILLNPPAVVAVVR